MSKQIFSYLAVITLFLAGCCKANFYFRTILNNPTANEIELRLFRQGDNTVYKIGAKTNSHVIEDALIGDSLYVLKGNKLTEIHYASETKDTSTVVKVRLFTDQGNLLNTSAAVYQQGFESAPCDGRTTILTYTFK